jgi:V/A-type H+/Na+-transporting ATPase subunit K
MIFLGLAVALIALILIGRKLTIPNRLKLLLGSLVVANVVIFILVSLGVAGVVWPGSPVFASTQQQTTTTTSTLSGTVALAAALSTGLSAIASGIAVAVVGSAAVGAVSENPDNLGRTLIYVGLAEGIAIYGLIVSFMILTR